MQVAKEFLKFVDSSPSPFHAVETASSHLRKSGFKEIYEDQQWDLLRGGKYFYSRNKSALMAFTIGGRYVQSNGFSIIGAHTDSPCLKLKPISKREKFGFLQVGVEVYGGGLWHTWFDRDLSLAGRVLIKNGDIFEHRLVKIDRSILRIPTLAIHLTDRSEGFNFNKEVQLTPILAQVVSTALNEPVSKPNVESKKLSTKATKTTDRHHTVMLDILAEQLGCSIDDIRDFELCLYDTQSAAIGGANDEFIHSARLDNLMMSYCSLFALINSLNSVPDDRLIRVVALFDNEEVGSTTAHGADSNFLEVTLKRLAAQSFESPQEIDSDWIILTHKESSFERAMVKSLLISADMAHALHPNYPEKHEEQHRPQMNKGVVIKQNANQRYATTAITTHILRCVAEKANVNLQEFVVRNDSPCGSTIGPMLSAKLGLRTVDVGNPQWSMHSIRETCGTADVADAISLFQAFFEHFADIDDQMPRL